MFPAFSIARLPRIEFGSGKLKLLPQLIALHGKRALIITGATSFRSSEHWPRLLAELTARHIEHVDLRVTSEPSPQLIDAAVRQFHDADIDIVIAIGGGSTLDAAKAIAGLLKSGHSVMDYLEGVGAELSYTGPATPFIAVPTSAGTGSEATKNAVLSMQGANGFKKSFRNEQLVPEYAIIDPDLLESCTPAMIAANGMDAFTQLLESLVSTKANAFTDALALSGLEAANNGLLDWYLNRTQNPDAPAQMAYAALLSGITLAQTGLGSVHGLASPLGAFFPIPHGVVCGTLVAAAADINVSALLDRAPQHPALRKYAETGRLLARNHTLDDYSARQALLTTLEEWTQRMSLPKLSSHGVTEADIPRIVANSRGSSMKTNPIVLSDDEVAAIILRRL
ncbi:alcohol dehydrogenase [Sulfuriferula sp. AH1]|uniref:iron-containing alcohol dehydrogenase n=1 Tax=Sulfuriferula sp. AH1 TaxID=1985873 RepID=UPI000B3B6ED8|nr:iron-containing alcohol dehydrogenase [Sulfuriferula sp. AH1]ARU32669.1 alcohol dehydrogenase [Sulfuriferula sp. AH1]